MSKEFDQFNQLTKDAFINILEEAKNKFLKSQEYEMATKMRI